MVDYKKESEDLIKHLDDLEKDIEELKKRGVVFPLELKEKLCKIRIETLTVNKETAASVINSVENLCSYIEGCIKTNEEITK